MEVLRSGQVDPDGPCAVYLFGISAVCLMVFDACCLLMVREDTAFLRQIGDSIHVDAVLKCDSGNCCMFLPHVEVLVVC